MTWAEVIQKAQAKKISREAMVMQEDWPDWVSIGHFWNAWALNSADSMGIMPSRYDLMLYAGIMLSIMGIFAFIEPTLTCVTLGIIINAVAFYLEIGAIYYERKNRPHSMTSNIGNIMAVGWIILHIILLIAIIGMTIQNGLD